ncbi:MAG: Fe-S protein assembly co-chaperone HscB [Gammaproteobacteria bacterium]|nr:Fe-S protein assembly co-chaperone HscB [Gammaproteobacteria bacterium]
MQDRAHPNYFDLLDVPRRYDLEIEQLAENYRRLQAQVHPDRFAQADPAERRASMQLATQANDAYRTLKDPVSRGQYLLELNGYDPATADRKMDTAFLEQQMTLRANLEEIPQLSEPLDRLDQLREQLAEQVKNRQLRLADTFNSLDPANLAQASNLVRELQFLDKLRQEAEELEEQLL